MTRGNSLLECPKCITNTLEVEESDVDEVQNIGIRRYRCKTCRHRFTFVEVMFEDPSGDPDPFLQLAANLRWKDRETRFRKKRTQPRRQLKPSDSIEMTREKGSVTLTYKRSPRRKQIFLKCKRGHELIGKNVYVTPSTGARVCMPCRRDYQREWIKKPEVRARRRELWQTKYKHRRRRNRSTQQQQEQTAA